MSRRSRSPSHSPSRSASYEREREERKRRRVTGWDVPPTAEQAAAAAAATLNSSSGIAPIIPPPAPAPATSGMIHPSRLGLVPLSASASPASSYTSAPPAFSNPALQRQARRLYVGNLPLPVAEHELRQLFNTSFPAAFPSVPPGDCVLSVYLNVEKKFGFVEFRTPDEATMALQLDGIQLRGVSLRVKRPSDYVPPPSGATAADLLPAMQPGNLPGFFAGASSFSASPFPQPSGLPLFPAGRISDQVPDGPFKLFCGGLPYSLPESDITELLSAYGDLQAFHLVRDKETGQSKGYCFFVYRDPSVTDGAIQGLHGISLGERSLTVRRAQPKGAGGGGGGGMGPGIDLSMIPALSGLLASSGSAASSASAGIPTRVLTLLNMVQEEETADTGEYEEILQDVSEEMAKYGRVLSVLIPRRGERGVGRVFVEYETVAESHESAGRGGGQIVRQPHRQVRLDRCRAVPQAGALRRQTAIH